MKTLNLDILCKQINIKLIKTYYLECLKLNFEKGLKKCINVRVSETLCYVRIFAYYVIVTIWVDSGHQNDKQAAKREPGFGIGADR